MDETREALLERKRQIQQGANNEVMTEGQMMDSLMARSEMIRHYYKCLVSVGFTPEESLFLAGRTFS